jgi:20S proteasome subunit alpha 6
VPKLPNKIYRFVLTCVTLCPLGHVSQSVPRSLMTFSRYDSDVTIWSPQGRLHQLEYAIEAVKQGSAAVGLRSNTHAILLAVKRSQDELASHQKKIDKVDRHLGLAYAGLMSDARVLCNFMRVRAMQSRFAYAREVPVKRLVDAVSESNDSRIHD